jgi:hypothetical protein
VLDVLVSEIGLQRPGIPPRVRLVETASVPQHVRVRLDLEPGSLASPANELLEVARSEHQLMNALTDISLTF